MGRYAQPTAEQQGSHLLLLPLAWPLALKYLDEPAALTLAAADSASPGKGTAMRIPALSAVLSACLLYGGCGAVFVPMRQKFPEPIAGVRVVDAATGQAIESANAVLEVYRHEGDKHLPARLLDAEVPADRAGQGSQGMPRRELAASRGDDGAFTFEAYRPFVWVQWFFPFRAAEGYTKYYDLEGRIRATAPGHAPLLFQYAALRPPVPGWSEKAGNGWAKMDSQGTLWFYLERRGPGAGGR